MSGSAGARLPQHGPRHAVSAELVGRRARRAAVERRRGRRPGAAAEQAGGRALFRLQRPVAGRTRAEFQLGQEGRRPTVGWLARRIGRPAAFDAGPRQHPRGRHQGPNRAGAPPPQHLHPAVARHQCKNQLFNNHI